MSETLDFSNVDSAEGGNLKYFKPGIYYVKPTNVELVKSKEGKSGIKVTFSAVTEEYEGGSIDEKFWLSPKALGRLQYLHEKIVGVKMENKSISYEDLTKYLKQKLLNKPKTFPLAINGEKSSKDGKVYARLPYTDFVLEDENIEEGAFKEGSEEYLNAVREGKSLSGSAPAMSGTGVSGSYKPVGDDTKMPWDE